MAAYRGAVSCHKTGDSGNVAGVVRLLKPTPPLHFAHAQKDFSASECLFFCADGVFGRCQELAAADLNTYELSSSALQRLRILLQKLAHKGTRCLFALPAWAACHCLRVFLPLDTSRSDRNCMSVFAWLKPAKEVKLSLWREETLSHIGPLFSLY